MSEEHGGLERPIRVVVFGGGPALEREFRRFLVRLDEHPDIDLLAAYCQSKSQSPLAIAGDLWRRRGLLAIPLLLSRGVGQAVRFLSDPRGEVELGRKVGRLSDRIRFVPDIHAEVVLEGVRELSADLGLVYGSPILKPKLFEIPRWGTLGIHHGKVPEYRGKKTAFWAMYNGERTVGVTIQKLGAGLDAGDVVRCGEVPAVRRSMRAVSAELETLGIDLYVEAILAVRRGTASCSPQVGKAGRLYRDPRFSDLARFWWRQVWVNRVAP
jgi:hypothetical protein